MQRKHTNFGIKTLFLLVLAAVACMSSAAYVRSSMSAKNIAFSEYEIEINPQQLCFAANEDNSYVSMAKTGSPHIIALEYSLVQPNLDQMRQY